MLLRAALALHLLAGCGGSADQPDPYRRIPGDADAGASLRAGWQGAGPGALGAVVPPHVLLGAPRPQTAPQTAQSAPAADVVAPPAADGDNGGDGDAGYASGQFGWVPDFQDAPAHGALAAAEAAVAAAAVAAAAAAKKTVEATPAPSQTASATTPRSATSSASAAGTRPPSATGSATATSSDTSTARATATSSGTGAATLTPSGSGAATPSM